MAALKTKREITKYMASVSESKQNTLTAVYERLQWIYGKDTNVNNLVSANGLIYFHSFIATDMQNGGCGSE